MDGKQFQELLLQSLEHERGGVKVCEAALTCAQSDDLKREWTRYLGQTRKHVRGARAVSARAEEKLAHASDRCAGARRRRRSTMRSRFADGFQEDLQGGRADGFGEVIVEAVREREPLVGLLTPTRDGRKHGDVLPEVGAQ